MQFTRALALLAVALPALAAPGLDRRQGGDKNADLQRSLSLSPDLVQPASGLDGQATPTAGQVSSDISTNNFINFCATSKLPLTNGEQIFSGSCNGIPMGEIMAKDKMPSAKILFPLNNGQIEEGTDINFQVKVKNIETGHFTNAQQTYYSAPAKLNAAGILIGHQHITVDAINGLQDTEPSDIQNFVFFKGLNDPAQNGVLSAVAAGGLKAGTYRACSMGSNANHAPIVPPVAQRASGEDCIRFTVTPKGGAAPAGLKAPAAGAAAAGAAAAAKAPAAAAAAAAAPAKAKGNGRNKNAQAGKFNRGGQRQRRSLDSEIEAFSANIASQLSGRGILDDIKAQIDAAAKGGVAKGADAADAGLDAIEAKIKAKIADIEAKIQAKLDDIFGQASADDSAAASATEAADAGAAAATEAASAATEAADSAATEAASAATEAAAAATEAAGSAKKGAAAAGAKAAEAAGVPAFRGGRFVGKRYSGLFQ